MTAVVGILNKKAVAIAADSAVTIGNTNKIFNRANKLFTLSKYFPVALMIYNNEDFMGTPWEVIIKVYRKQLDRQSFNTLAEYKDHFIQFLKNNRFFCDDNYQKNQVKFYLENLNNLLVKDIFKINPNLNLAEENSKDEFIKIATIKVEETIKILSDPSFLGDDFLNYSFEQFEPYLNSIFEDIVNDTFQKLGSFSFSEEFKTQLKHLYWAYIKSKEYFGVFTGLVFVGFGEQEIFSSVYSTLISFGFSDKLKYNSHEAFSVNHDNPSLVVRYGQADVIDTILSGIDPTLSAGYKDNFLKFLNEYNKLIIQSASSRGIDIAILNTLLNSIDNSKLIEQYNDANETIVNSNFIVPLFRAVEGLSKEDLAEMAESLIYLTYLKRRMTNVAESVGGPVDVAILSKGDGFIWIKRKHYFKPELNPNFFNNYFK